MRCATRCLTATTDRQSASPYIPLLNCGTAAGFSFHTASVDSNPSGIIETFSGGDSYEQIDIASRHS
jgi:hypothetical protein